MDYIKISVAVYLLIASASGRGLPEQGSNYASIDELAKQDHYYKVLPEIDREFPEESDEYDDQDIISQNQQIQEGINAFYDQNQQEEQEQQQEDDSLKNQQQKDEEASVEKNNTNFKRSQDSTHVHPLQNEQQEGQDNESKPQPGIHEIGLEEDVKPKYLDEKHRGEVNTEEPNKVIDKSINYNAPLHLVDDKEEGIDGVIVHSNIDSDSLKREPFDLEHGGIFDSHQTEKENKKVEPTTVTIGPQDGSGAFTSQIPNKEHEHGNIPKYTTVSTADVKVTQDSTNIGNDIKKIDSPEQSTSVSTGVNNREDIANTQYTSEDKSLMPTIETKDNGVSQNNEKDQKECEHPEQSTTMTIELLEGKKVDDSTLNVNEDKEEEVSGKGATVAVGIIIESGVSDSKHTQKDDKNEQQSTTVSLPAQDDNRMLDSQQNVYDKNNDGVIEKSTTASVQIKDENKVFLSQSTTPSTEVQNESTVGDKKLVSSGQSTVVNGGNKYDSGSIDSQQTKKENDDGLKLTTILVEPQDLKKIIDSQNAEHQDKVEVTTETDKTSSSTTKIITTNQDHTSAPTSTRDEMSTHKNEVSTTEHAPSIPPNRPQNKPHEPWNLPRGPWDHPRRPWDQHRRPWEQDDDRWGYDEFGPWNQNRPWGHPRSQDQYRHRDHHNYHRHDFPSKGGR